MEVGLWKQYTVHTRLTFFECFCSILFDGNTQHQKVVYGNDVANGLGEPSVYQFRGVL